MMAWVSRVDDVPQRVQGDHDRRGLGRAEPQRPGEVVGVLDPDHAVADRAALLGLDRVEVDVDQVVGQPARQPAHEEDLEVAQHLRGRGAEQLGGVGEAHLVAVVQEGHQGQQAGDLVAGPGCGRAR